MSPLRVLVVDDEPLARAGLGAILAEEDDVVVVGESAGGEEAVRDIRALEPDAVFLDVAMPDLDGFGVLERLDAAARPEIVFVTAHGDQALRAFDARALDYVTKPLRRERVREALARVRTTVKHAPRGSPAAGRPGAPAGPLVLRVDGRVVLVDPATVDWISADDDHVVVHAGPTRWRVRETLGALERRLDPAAFVRVHRSTIVRLAAVREIQPWFRGDHVLILHGGQKLRLSRRFRRAVAARLGCDL